MSLDGSQLRARKQLRRLLSRASRDSQAVVLIGSYARGTASPLSAIGVLIYETFMAGNEKFGRPSNPAFLLRPGELLTAFSALAPIALAGGAPEGGSRAPSIVRCTSTAADG